MSNAETRPARSRQNPARPTRNRRPAWQWTLLAVGAVFAAYLVVRWIVELVTIHYGDPASYVQDWGGPTLAGVLAVHSGPAAAIAAAVAWRWRRRRRAARASAMAARPVPERGELP